MILKPICIPKVGNMWNRKLLPWNPPWVVDPIKMWIMRKKGIVIRYIREKLIQVKIYDLHWKKSQNVDPTMFLS